MKFLFPDNAPPMLPSECGIDEACTWLLAVMDEHDRARTFVVSLLSQFLDRGWLSEKQMDALYSVISKVSKKHAEGELECQGAAPARKQMVTHGKVISAFGRDDRDDGEVLE